MHNLQLNSLLLRINYHLLNNWQVQIFRRVKKRFHKRIDLNFMISCYDPINESTNWKQWKINNFVPAWRSLFWCDFFIFLLFSSHWSRNVLELARTTSGKAKNQRSEYNVAAYCALSIGLLSERLLAYLCFNSHFHKHNISFWRACISLYINISLIYYVSWTLPLRINFKLILMSF